MGTCDSREHMSCHVNWNVSVVCQPPIDDRIIYEIIDGIMRKKEKNKKNMKNVKFGVSSIFENVLK